MGANGCWMTPRQYLQGAWRDFLSYLRDPFSKYPMSWWAKRGIRMAWKWWLHPPFEVAEFDR